jgi:hypothetical protein
VHTKRSFIVATPWTQVIVGAHIVDYLLEISRVCVQGKLERNYHVFYGLLSLFSGGVGSSSDLGNIGDQTWYRVGGERGVTL